LHSRRVVLEDRIQLPQLTLVWPTVEAWHPHEARINLLADVLARCKQGVALPAAVRGVYGRELAELYSAWQGTLP